MQREQEEELWSQADWCVANENKVGVIPLEENSREQGRDV